MIMPFYWTLSTSIKPNSEIFALESFWIPRQVTAEHYISVFTKVPFGRYFLNSLFLASAGVMTNLFFGGLAGYAFAKLYFRGKKFIFITFLASMMIPGIVVMIPQFLVLRFFPLAGGNDFLGRGGSGFINSYGAIILPGAAGAFAVFFMRQFFLALPNEMGDSARIDGCGEFGIFGRIYLPLTKPALATLGIMTFQGGWNSFMWPLIVLNDETKMTIQVGLSRFAYEHGSDFGPLMAGTVIATLPMLAIFFYAQKYFVQGIAFTGGKN
jgi:multiple sugar transport system permease protein